MAYDDFNFMPYALRLMPYALCVTPNGLCIMPYALCLMSHADVKAVRICAVAPLT